MTAGERYVVIGLAHVRSVWFRDLARWATSAAVPCEFVKCVSVEEVRARLASSRTFSALIVDSSVPGVDRDLVDVARRGGCAVLVVDDGRVERDWEGLGASALLESGFDRVDLVSALHATARPVGRHDIAFDGTRPEDTPPPWRAPLVAVTGPGGTGASVVAMAVAQGLADDPRNAGMVLLADLALHADQAMLHDARDVVPGLLELVDAHRSGQPTPDEVRALAFDVANRRYHLMLGLRRHRDWAALRPRAVEAALVGARASYRLVVADVDADVEGERECGSVEVEERNVLARAATSSADVVAVVGVTGPKGVHSLARTVREVLTVVDPARVLPVVTRAPRSPRRRAEISRALAVLVTAAGGVAPPSPALYIPEWRHLDDAIRDGTRLPTAATRPITTAVLSLLHRVAAMPAPASGDDELRPLRPGELGAWAR